jgi:hypothetical protein
LILVKLSAFLVGKSFRKSAIAILASAADAL